VCTSCGKPAAGIGAMLAPGHKCVPPRERYTVSGADGITRTFERECAKCGGTGAVTVGGVWGHDETCPRCSGTGRGK
jgi:hypothetical protein